MQCTHYTPDKDIALLQNGFIYIFGVTACTFSTLMHSLVCFLFCTLPFPFTSKKKFKILKLNGVYLKKVPHPPDPKIRFCFTMHLPDPSNHRK